MNIYNLFVKQQQSSAGLQRERRAELHGARFYLILAEENFFQFVLTNTVIQQWLTFTLAGTSPNKTGSSSRGMTGFM